VAKAKKVKLTKTYIDRAEYEGTNKSRDARWDRTLPGFGVRVYPSGRKSFIIKYTNKHGRQRQKTLGTFGELTLQQARQLARDDFHSIRKGNDPLAEREQALNAETIDDLCSAYIDKHAKPHKKSWKKDDSRLERHIKPVWGSRTPAEITHSNVAELHRAVGKNSGHYEANRTLALIQTMFNFAADEGFIERETLNPAANVKKLDADNRIWWGPNKDNMPALKRFLSEVKQGIVPQTL